MLPFCNWSRLQRLAAIEHRGVECLTGVRATCMVLTMARSSYYNRIKSRISELEQQIDELQSELDELRVAERVLDRLGSNGDEESAPKSSASSGRKKETVASKILESLQILGPMTSSDITELLQTDWRSDLTFATVSSTLSRLRSRGQVQSDGRQWFLPDQEKPPEADAPGGFDDQSDGGGEVRESGVGAGPPEGANPSASARRHDLLSGTARHGIPPAAAASGR